uniref:Uncharacterized protein n=1 Tax=Amazona collaria TaxID=241587 RepID=A0A8B9EY56_9PSIT
MLKIPPSRNPAACKQSFHKEHLRDTHKPVLTFPSATLETVQVNGFLISVPLCHFKELYSEVSVFRHSQAHARSYKTKENQKRVRQSQQHPNPAFPRRRCRNNGGSPGSPSTQKPLA